MDDNIRGGRGNFLESSMTQDSSDFDPMECGQLIDDLHKLF